MTEFEEICEENYSRIYKYALGMIGNRESAEDIVQDTFFIAYKKGRIFLEHENPKAFLYKTANNLVMEFFRKNKKETLLETENFDLKDMDVFEKMCRNHDWSIDESLYIEKIISGFTEKERILYEQYYVRKRKMHDIAKELGMSDAALRMKYVRLRKKVKMNVQDLKLNEF